MSARPPAAVLWDMDGTLLDTQPHWDAAICFEAERMGPPLSEQAITALVGASSADTARYLLRWANFDVTQDRVREVIARIDLRMEDELIRRPVPWRPGARELAHEIRAAGIPQALVTSTDRKFVSLLMASTIGPDIFAEVVCGDEVEGYTKPHPEPYRRAIRRLGVNSRDCLALEDSSTGSGSAVRAGCAVLVVPHRAPVPPSRHIALRESLTRTSLGDLIALFNRHQPEE